MEWVLEDPRVAQEFVSWMKKGSFSTMGSGIHPWQL